MTINLGTERDESFQGNWVYEKLRFVFVLNRMTWCHGREKKQCDLGDTSRGTNDESIHPSELYP